ncbi:hypothetical protein, partial [Roseibacillus persicicus]|uniref:hypothetical protein n=1 Tax=Roseibacillus persicicus TaxID=454148 RepID=UPI00280D0043
PPLCQIENEFEKLPMNNSDNPRKTSRRSFIKKSVVASVAATNLTMFSGLVNAQSASPSPRDPKCELQTWDQGVTTIFLKGGGTIQVTRVRCRAINCASGYGQCGEYPKLTNGTAELDSDGKVVTVPVDLPCYQPDSVFIACLVSTVPAGAKDRPN